MNVGRAVERLDSHPPEKLRHLRGLVQADLDSYKECARNYPPDRWERCAVPFIAVRTEWLRRIDARMEACGIPPYDSVQPALGMSYLSRVGERLKAHEAKYQAQVVGRTRQPVG